MGNWYIHWSPFDGLTLLLSPNNEKQKHAVMLKKTKLKLNSMEFMERGQQKAGIFL